MTAGRTRLLIRLLKAATVPDRAPRVLGVDEFAFCKGRTYGTVLVDVEAGRVVDPRGQLLERLRPRTWGMPNSVVHRACRRFGRSASTWDAQRLYELGEFLPEELLRAGGLRVHVAVDLQ